MSDTGALLKTPLHGLHLARGAKMAGFAGYDMPIQYAEGVMAEHLWTRKAAGLFDVSHMGPCFLTLGEDGPEDPDERHKAVSAILETLCPSSIAGLKPGQVRYTVFLNEDGGVLDDLMVARPAEEELQGTLHIVVNASMKAQDFALIEKAAAGRAMLKPAEGYGLIALQGPEAAAVLDDLFRDDEEPWSEQGFMSLRLRDLGDLFGPVWATRSGYTGEDGIELLVRPSVATLFAERLLADARVKPIGLGARDSLRLEAGLCLYGNDLDPSRSPVEGSIQWIIQKRRREAGDFPGAARILRELAEGASVRRVGIRPLGRAPARAHTEIQSEDGRVIGEITSGGYGPSVEAPIAMGYVEAAFAAAGTPVKLIVRGKALDAVVADMPFHPHAYAK